MRAIRVWLLAGALAALHGFACQPRASGGFTAPDAGPGDDAGAPITQAITWHQDPDSEILQCHYFKLNTDAAAEIARIKVDFPQGSHHVHVYHASVDVPDHVEDCTNIDWTTWSLVVGVQTTPIDWTLPQGVTVPITPHEQIMVQVHWLNTTPQPIDREVDLSLYPTETSTAHLGVIFGVSKDVYMEPGQSKSVSNFDPIPAGVNITAMMGHFHARGTHYAVDLRKAGESSGDSIYEASDEQTFEFKRYDPPPVTQSGQGLVYQCDFTNTTTGVLTWGANTATQEHCNMAAYYYPATDPLSHLYLGGEIATASATPGTVPVGGSADAHVQLEEQAGPLGVDVVVQQPSGSGLSAPAGVHVPGWAWGADFTVQGTAPGSTTIGLTTGAGVTPLLVPVFAGDAGAPDGGAGGGLVLSEVLYDPTSGPAGWQWVEIANVGATAIDLSGYSLAAGGAAYGTVRAGLGSVILPVDGCLVVGGPNGLPAPDPAAGTYTVAEAFTPPLPTSSTPASGVALFAVPLAQALPAGAIPVDSVVYGTTNTSGLLGPDGQPGAPVPATPPGSSLERTTAWQVQPTPTPGICRVSHAH
jgi:hypothetical protein